MRQEIMRKNMHSMALKSSPAVSVWQDAIKVPSRLWSIVYGPVRHLISVRCSFDQDTDMQPYRPLLPVDWYWSLHATHHRQRHLHWPCVLQEWHFSNALGREWLTQRAPERITDFRAFLCVSGRIFHIFMIYFIHIECEENLKLEERNCCESVSCSYW